MKKTKDEILDDLAKISFETGKIIVERKELIFLIGILIGFLAPQSSLACGLIAKEKALEKQNLGDFLKYVKSYISPFSWLTYFKSGKNSPEYFYYKKEISMISSKISPIISPIMYLTVGTGLGFLISTNFSCIKLEKKFLNCMNTNKELIEEVAVIIDTLNQGLDILETP